MNVEVNVYYLCIYSSRSRRILAYPAPNISQYRESLFESVYSALCCRLIETHDPSGDRHELDWESVSVSYFAADLKFDPCGLEEWASILRIRRRRRPCCASKVREEGS